MTEEERNVKIFDILNYWLPVRWTDGINWWEVKNVTVTGTVEEGSANLAFSKNDGDTFSIEFTNDEMYGDSVLSPDAAKARVMGV